MRRAIAMLFIFLPAVALAETGHQVRQLELSADGIGRLEITCGAGTFELISVAGLGAIRVEARIEVEGLQGDALQAFVQKNVRLKLEKRKNTAVLQSEVGVSSMKNKEVRINLSMTVPDNLEVKITDASGFLRIENFQGNLEIDDDSGRIEIESIVGNVKINDGSGGMVIEDVTDLVTVRDGSGPIEIYYVEGDVGVTDGSGDIKIRNIDGNVTVMDASGDIDIKEVMGNVHIGQAGTGDLDVDLVGGNVTIRQ